MKEGQDEQAGKPDQGKETIAQLVKTAGEHFLVSGPACESAITAIETELDVTLPESCKCYVKRYGHGGIGNVEIFGAASNTANKNGSHKEKMELFAWHKICYSAFFIQFELE
ncbi:MAG: SMI1/KNR4 family protein [Spirochaetales bacterium]|nr:SMI1/KNR4 family protein [Spirochaetales bacterium]